MNKIYDHHVDFLKIQAETEICMPPERPDRYNRKLPEWTEQEWEQEFEELMQEARRYLDPQLERKEIVVLRTAKGTLRVVEIPDYCKYDIWKPLEDACMQKMAEEGDTRVIACLATVNGQNPEILSWNFRSGLIDLNEANLATECFLWGGDDRIYVKPFCRLLPPKQ